MASSQAEDDGLLPPLQLPYVGVLNGDALPFPVFVEAILS